MKQPLMSFTLTMPGRGGWNGQWSGSDRLYVDVRRRPPGCEITQCDFHYHWADGWTACVSARVVDAKEAERLRRKTNGFAGHDWMIDSILSKGRIEARP